MPAYYREPLLKLLQESPSSIVGQLAVANADARFPLTPESIEAWQAQLPPFVEAARQLLEAIPAARSWELLFEYPIPRVGKRIDAVLLAGNIIIVMEAKTGMAPNSARRQVEDYALNLACFHEGSKNGTIVPLVVSDAKTWRKLSATEFDTLIKPCYFTSTQGLGGTLQQIHAAFCESRAHQINAKEWDEGRFSPIPPIIDAAVALYSDMDVFEIGHACTAQADLDKATRKLVSEVLDAKRNSTKVICFVTGVPGAGKTLVGLNTVHQPELRHTASFLSGNGPLVNVIQEALIRDVIRRSSIHEVRPTRRELEIKVRTFVHNVHRFADEYYRGGKHAPVQNVVIFDEAQRAWNAEENQRAKRPNVSEATMMLEVMDRHSDWAVVIALIGGGQEINRGEAGLNEWGRALARFPKWQVRASPQVLTASISDTRFRLFEKPDPCPERVQEAPEFHLSVCTRSIRAQKISDWVDAILAGAAPQAAAIASELLEKPTITRSLNRARQWLKVRRRGTTRSGLVASAYAARLRADGLEISFDFHRGFDWDHWFLDDCDCESPICDHKYCNDIRCSSKLEVAATQFEIQGLELDWVGVCWGEDLVWSGERWKTNRYNNKIWRENRNPTKHNYLMNGYRVLLTRARQGMIIYVPDPPADALDRLQGDLERTAAFLLACGAQQMTELSAFPDSALAEDAREIPRASRPSE